GHQVRRAVFVGRASGRPVGSLGEVKTMSKPVVTEEDVRQALMDVIDPELGFNIVDLGLIYGVTVEDDKVDIVMTMTTPGCPASLYLQEGTRQRVLAVPGVAEV